MKLGMFMMPVHPLHRNATETLKEDREAVILADQLGYHDVFIGEHLTDQAENITNSLLFLATLIHSTKRIKLGTGTCNLSQQHPVLVAAQAAMFDHLAQGRFILGVSPGALPSDAEAIGILDQDRNKMFAESIDVILKIWESEPPYDIDLPGNRFKVTTRKNFDPTFGTGIMPRPFQKPRPEIVGTVVAPFSKGVIIMGERDFHPLSANFLLPHWLKSHWTNYAEGKTAASYGRHDANSPYRFYYKQLQTKLTKAGRHVVFKERADQPDSEISYDFVLDRLCMYGTVNKVVDPKLEKRSMQLMAEQVMPRVNAAIAKESGGKRATA